MINYVAADDGMLEFYNDDVLVVKSDDANVLADAIVAAGGFASACYSSSSMNFADEYGFDSQFACDKLFKTVCEYV
jgi:hypothetical protein